MPRVKKEASEVLALRSALGRRAAVDNKPIGLEPAPGPTKWTAQRKLLKTSSWKVMHSNKYSAWWIIIGFGLGIIAGLLGSGVVCTWIKLPAVEVLNLQGSPRHRVAPQAPSRCLFLDIGSNRGDVLKKFYNLDLERSNNQFWRMPYANYSPKKWEVHAFEASPIHYETLKSLKEDHGLDRLHLHFQIVSDRNGTAELFRDTTAGDNGEWGTSTDQSLVTNAQKDIVPTLDFAQWFKKKLAAQEYEEVLVKMNIEGGEYVVFDSLAKHGLLCQINRVWIYWHSQSKMRPAQNYNNVMKHIMDSCGVDFLTWSVH